MRSLGLIMLALGLMLAGSARAERYGVLVGVSTYTSLRPDHQLHGPVNDVQLMLKVLRQRGVDSGHLQVLADGIAGARLPTRAAILAALDTVEEQVKPGDFVYVYFAGHGSQMPTDPAVPPQYRKPDGRQEIILPRDIGRWDGKLGRVQNAIADFELTRHVDVLRARGASVWAIFDACQSATLVRGGGESAERRTRFVDPRDLGIPVRAFPGAVAGSHLPDLILPAASPEATARGGQSSATAIGGYVAFYAAQTYEPAEEDRLPAGDRSAVTRGIFTYTLASALLSAPQGTYRQLGALIRSRYAAENLVTATPLFTGSLLDAPVFGDLPQPRVRQWPLSRTPQGMSISAGMLEGVGEGAVLALLASPMDQDGATLGHVQATHTSGMHADLVPIATRGQAPVDMSTLPSGLYARLVRPALSFALRVSAPAERNGARMARLHEVMNAAKTRLQGTLEVAWVPSGQASDFALQLQQERIRLVPTGESGQTARAHRTAGVLLTAPDAPDQLSADLLTVAKVLNLLRICATLNAAPIAPGLKVTLSIHHAGHVSLLTAERVAALRRDDEVYVTVENDNQNLALDVTALYIDSRYGIRAIDTAPPGQGIRRLAALANSEAPAKVTFGWRVSTETAGLERLLLIAVPEHGSEIQDFNYLEQPRLPEIRAAASDAEELLDAAVFGRPVAEPTRNGTPRALASLQMALYSFVVDADPAQSQLPIRTKGAQ